MGEELVPTGVAYAYVLLDNWKEIGAMDEQVRVDILQERMGARLVHEFIAKLTRMWLELSPMVEGRTEEGVKEIAVKFATYREFYLDPSLLLKKENAKKIFELEEECRKILNLKITKFEGTDL